MSESKSISQDVFFMNVGGECECITRIGLMVKIDRSTLSQPNDDNIK